MAFTNLIIDSAGQQKRIPAGPDNIPIVPLRSLAPAQRSVLSTQYDLAVLRRVLGINEPKDITK